MTGQEQIQPSSELINNSGPIDNLRQLRMLEAEKRAESALRRVISGVDEISEPSTAFVDVATSDVSYDNRVVSNKDLLVLDSFGNSPSEVLSTIGEDKGSENEELFTLNLGEETITAKRFGDGVTLNFEVEGEEPRFDYSRRTPQKIKQKIIDRYEESPGHKAINNLAKEIQQNDFNDTASTQEFDYTVDKLGTAALLESLGFVSTRATVDPEKANIEDLISHSSSIKSVELEDGKVQFIKNSQGINTSLLLDRNSGLASIVFDKDKSYYYSEKANQSEVNSVPFIETKCAEELLTTLDELGLMINPDLQSEMIRVGDAERFGSIYTQITREIAKWVNRDSRVNLQNLFVSIDEDNYDEIATELIKEKLLSIDEDKLSEPTKLLFGLAKQAVTRDASADLPSLGITGSNVEVRDGACFDVAGYYLGAAGNISDLKTIKVGDVEMLEKTYGNHTFMLQHPTVLNGVELPKGTLMQRGEDGGWAMLRLTPFCFDDPADQLATGSELSKAYAYQVEAIKRIGGTVIDGVVRKGVTLDNLINATK